MTAELRSWATVRQLEYLDAIEAHGSNRKAAKALGVDSSVIDKSMRALKAKAARHLLDPHRADTPSIPEGFAIKGTTTLYGEDGKARMQWVKTTAEQEQRDAAIREAFEVMAQDLPRLPAVPAPKVTTDHLATVYTLTDSHVGMLAWHKEGGADWDLAIAERTLIGCFERMVNASPAASVGFVNQLGDFLHSDGLLPITPTSHHVLDQDGRYSKLVQTAVRILRRVIDLALTKHQKVVVLLAEGNHDMASSIWLRVMFRALYENEPRVEVIDSELPFYAWQHGRTMLAFHHGHLKKNNDLPLLFAAQFPQVWGSTVKRYAHVGHRHHVEEKEHSGMKVVQHATLAARDAYAARGGWISERQVQAITYHQEHGEVARNTVTPEMLS